MSIYYKCSRNVQEMFLYSIVTIPISTCQLSFESVISMQKYLLDIILEIKN